MRQILTFLLFIIGLSSIQAQSPTRIKLTQLEQAKTVESSKAGQIGLTNSAGDQRYAQYVEIDLVQIGFVPTYTGNTSNYSEFVVASDSTRWYIDWQGRGFPLGGSSGPDKNGYYGGNGGNGGDATIPSSTTSTITNQFTLYKPGVTDFDDLTPVRLVVDSGNESPFMAFVQGTDSMLVKRSDTEFSFKSQRGIFTQSNENIGLLAGGIVNIVGDSINIQTVPTAFAGERTFLTYSPGLYITKKEGIDSTDLNFDAIQNLSATGAGPASYNITLSDGGAVTLQEGTNIDLTRVGNTITIAATGGGGGGQTFDNTSTATTHTLTLSGAGGSIQYIEGTGIGFATGGTGLDGTLTITNTSPDQTVTITNGGGITVTGTYPNFTLTAADQSPTNELQTLNNTSTSTTHTATLSNSGGSLQLAEGTGIGLATTGTGLDGVVTITNSSPDQTVTITNGGGITVTGTYPNFTLTAADQSATNELQTLNNTSTSTTHTATLSNSGGSLQLAEGTGIGLATTGTGLDGVVTITNTSPDQTVTITNGGGITVTGTYPNFTLTAADQSATNELQTLNNTSSSTTHTATLSNSGGSLQLAEGTGIGLATTGTPLDGVVTITNTSPDQTVTITNGGGITVTGTYPNFTLTAADQSATNEIQTISASGSGPTSYNIDLSLSGGSVTLQEGANVDLTRVGNTISIASIASTSIYNASDTIFPNCNSRVADNAYWRTNYFSGNRAFEINDLSDYFWIQSDGQESALQLDNTGIVLSVYDAGHTQHGEVFVSPNGAELDFEGNIIQVNQYGIQCLGVEPFFPSSLTTTERNALFPVVEGAIIYNETDLVFQFRQNGAWVNLAAASPDQSITNEGLLSVGAGGSNSSEIISNTSGSPAVTLTGSGNVTITESGNNITISSTAGGLSYATYTAGTTTVSVPAGAVAFSATVVGGAGGGGSGRKGAAASTRFGGGGGAPGGVSIGFFYLSDLGSPSNITVEVGAGGAGGASQATNSTSGNNGTNGQLSQILITGSTILRAGGGPGGSGGTAAAGSGGSNGNTSDFIQSAGGAGGSLNGTTPSSSTNKVGGAGGGGAGINSSNTTGTGGGGAGGYYNLAAGVSGGAGAGSNGTAATVGQLTGSGGAGGGTSGAAKADGGNGGYPGGAGGGGNAGIDSTYDSGKGGNGADGICLITWYY